MKYSPSPSYILHSRRFQDTSVIVDTFTQEHGRLSFIAKGAINPKSKFRGILQPGRLLMLAGSGKSELLTLTLAEELPSQADISGNLFYSVAYLNELLIKLMAKADSHPEIFILYQHTLLKLGQEPEQLEWHLRFFEYQFLWRLGLVAEFNAIMDIQTESHLMPNIAEIYCYHPEIGLCIYGQYPEIVAPTITGEAVIHLIKKIPLPLDARASRQSLKRLMRRVIDIHIPSGLKSREVMKEILKIQLSKKN